MPPLVTTMSIVVGSHRPESAARLAERLSMLVHRDSAVEAILVTDYSSATLAARFPSLKWLYVNDYSIPRKRNAGLAFATGRCVGFTDDDCLPQEDWIDQARNFLDSHVECCAVEGHTIIEIPQIGGNSLREFKRLERPGYRTNNIVYRRETLEKAGGFDERFYVQREDLDLALTVIEHGGTIGWCDTMRVQHEYRHNEPWDLLKNCWNRRFDPLLYRKHPDGYRRMVGSPVPRSLVIIGLCETAFVVSCMFGITAPMVTGLLLLAALTTAAILRRGAVFSQFRDFPRELAAMACAPTVIAAALILGSVRYKTVLLI